MPLEESYSLTTKEGHEYKIGFSAFDVLQLPDNVKKDVADVVIAIDDNKGINNARTLFQISEIIKEYLTRQDVILYCYCDSKDIERGKGHQGLTPQEYRSLLFQKMFSRASNKDLINKPITLTDLKGEVHCIHLISTAQNKDDVEILSNEIYKLHK